jgi:HAE1 family hydrophobic/amphiphilic exporter-1
MRRRWAVMLGALLVTISIVPLFMMVGKDFLPKDDQSEFEIAITTPAGWTLEKTDHTFREIEQQLRGWPQVVNVMSTIGDTSGKVSKGQGEVTQGAIYVRLVDLKDRKKVDGRTWDQFGMMAQARKVMANYPDLRSSVQVPQAISSGAANADVEFTLVGPDLRRLGEYSDGLVAKLRANPGLADVDTTLALRKPELRVVLDEKARDRASDLGVSVRTIASTLRVLVGGEIVSDYKDETLGELYDVWLRADAPDRDDRRTVQNLTVPSERPGIGLVKLGNISRLDEGRGPAQIDRFARQRKITVVANLNGIPTNDAVAAFNKSFAELGAPGDYALIASGRAKTQAESNDAFFLAFLFSLVFMYMILAAQFESFVHPITILMAVPLTIPFAVLSLLLLGQALTIYSILGVFLLFGIVKKNGILQVDYTNVLRGRAAEDGAVVPAVYREGQAVPAGAGGNGDGAAAADFSPHDVRSSGAETLDYRGVKPAAVPVRALRGWDRWMARQSPEKRVRLWAIMEANRTRLRPILMTTLMLIAGMVPIALGQGPGSASRASMAKVIVGGQALSLLLSLLVTPVAYSLFDDLAIWWRRRFGHPKAARADVPEVIEAPAIQPPHPAQPAA